MISYVGCDINEKGLKDRMTIYVNENLEEMIRVFIDYLNENDGIDLSDKLLEVFPRDYVIKNVQECRNNVYELYEIIYSSVIREYIKPEYEYLLYHIIYYWMDACGRSDLPIKLDEKLEEDIRSCKEFIVEDKRNVMLDTLNDLKRFLKSCFYDLDFLEDNLSRLVMLYLKSITLFGMIYPDVELDKYINLMPVDLRELYIEKKQKIENYNNESASLVHKLTINILQSCAVLQGNKKYHSAIENERNTFLASLLEAKGYNVKDQTLWGTSKTGKSSGEIDIFISDENKVPLSIIEAMNLSSLDKSYIDVHLHKIWGYDANGLKHNFIIVYSNAKGFLDLWEKYIKYIKNFKYKYEFIDFYECKIERFSEIKLGIAIHKRNGEEVYLNHIFVNMNI